MASLICQAMFYPDIEGIDFRIEFQKGKNQDKSGGTSDILPALIPSENVRHRLCPFSKSNSAELMLVLSKRFRVSYLQKLYVIGKIKRKEDTDSDDPRNVFF